MDPQQILLDTHEFDYLVLGTGLTDSLFAACLAKRKHKVIILDIDKSYSSSLQTLNLKEFHSLFTTNQKKVEQLENERILKKRSIFSHFFLDSTINQQQPPTEYKGYNIDLQPKVLFSTSLTVDLMREADMDKYMEFRAINALFHYDNEKGKFLETPSSKGQIFVHSDLTLLEKRTLFKTLQAFINVFHWKHGVKVDPNSTAEFDKAIEIDEDFMAKYEQYKQENCMTFLNALDLKGKVKDILLYTLASCEENPENGTSAITTEELFRRMFKFVKSLGVHSNLPFLYTMYGTGDIPQAFARIAAVYGSIFIINDGIKVHKIEKEGSLFRIYSDIAGDKQFFTCKGIIVGMEYNEEISKIMDQEFLEKESLQPINNVAKQEYLLRLVMVFEGDFNITEINEELEPEKIKKLPLIYVIPPKNEVLQNKNPVTFIIFGSNTYSCPKGKFLVNVKTVVDENKGNFEEFSAKIRDFLLKEVSPQQKDWKILFSGGFLQEKTHGNLNFKENSGIFFIKNNDFTLDLDNYFKEFVDNIGKFIAEFSGEDKTGFFTNQNKENEELEEGDGKSEINKLLEKLDNIVLNKENKNISENIEKSEESKKEEKNENIADNIEKSEEIKKEEKCPEKHEENKEENEIQSIQKEARPIDENIVNPDKI